MLKMSQTPNQQNDGRHALYFDGPEIEIRSAESGAPVRVFGYSALFNVRSQEMRTNRGKRFVEIILPGAFDNANFSDCECRYDHHLFISSRYRSGVDDKGRWFEYDHDPSDPDHVSVLAKIRRGEVRGASFMFDEPDIVDQEIVKEGPLLIRKIKRFSKIWDEGPVRKPAYRQTMVSARSLDEYPDTDLEEPTDASEPTEQRDMSGAYDANTNPTPAQKEAGNYKKGKVRVAGMAMSIENPKGSMRSGTNKEGKAWEIQMTAHYGYILGSNAGDGDNLDVFLTDDAETARLVFVIDQINPDGSFDEHKCVIGPATEADARALYLAHYEEGWTGLGAICSVPMACFRAWAMDGSTKKQPLMYGGTAGMLYAPYLEAMRTVLESGGNAAEQQRNMGGTEEEQQRNADGTPEETGGTPVEVRGTQVETGGTTAEQQQQQELLKRRKLQVRATLLG